MFSSHQTIIEDNLRYFGYLRDKAARLDTANYTANNSSVGRAERERTLITLIDEASGLGFSERAIQLAITYFDVYVGKTAGVEAPPLDTTAFLSLQLAHVFEHCKDLGQTRRYQDLPVEALEDQRLQMLSLLEFNLDRPTASDFFSLLFEMLGEAPGCCLQECERTAVLAYAFADSAFEGPLVVGCAVLIHVFLRSSKPELASQVQAWATELGGVELRRLEACVRTLACIHFSETASIPMQPCVLGLN